MTDGETNGLWNPISCETYSKGVAASTIIHNHANTTLWLRLGKANGVHLAEGTSDYFTDRNGTFLESSSELHKHYPGLLLFKK